MKTFGETLGAILKERGMKATELCRLSGENTAYMSRLLNGKVKDPTFAKACAICDALGMTTDEFLALQREGRVVRGGREH